ncbi:MAG: DUF1049 domain-containing protein [Candidatus Aminicenantes bacterium]|nr:DUF1049 domain-containing protein [Candidatus Aminicenantes bacterium]
MKFITFARRHKALTLLTLISFVVLIVLFQNSDSVNFNVLFWRFSAQKVIFILVAMFLGYIIGKLVELSFRKRS